MAFQPLTTVSAKVGDSLTFPASAPPTNFIISGSGNNFGFIPVVISSTVSSAYSSVTGFFTVPELPEGFAAARPVSPAYSFFGNIFGLFASSSAVEYMPPSSGNGVEFDYDGDGKADPAVRHPQSGTWTVKQSSTGNGVTTTFEAAAAFMTSGDFDGDSMTARFFIRERGRLSTVRRRRSVTSHSERREIVR